MLSRETKKHVEQRLCQEFFKEYCEIVEKYNCKLKFQKRAFDSENFLNADFGLLRKDYIVATPEWAARLILNKDDEEVRTAFKITLGHELGHKHRRHSNITYSINHARFICCVNELYADFWSAQNAANASRILLLQSMAYKQKNKMKIIKKSGMTLTLYPTWAKRMEYVRNNDFDEHLIHRIAKDNKCSGKRIETTVINFYKGYDIHLFPPPEPLDTKGDTN